MLITKHIAEHAAIFIFILQTFLFKYLPVTTTVSDPDHLNPDHDRLCWIQSDPEGWFYIKINVNFFTVKKNLDEKSTTSEEDAQAPRKPLALPCPARLLWRLGISKIFSLF